MVKKTETIPKNYDFVLSFLKTICSYVQYLLVYDNKVHILSIFVSFLGNMNLSCNFSTFKWLALFNHFRSSTSGLALPVFVNVIDSVIRIDQIRGF